MSTLTETEVNHIAAGRCKYVTVRDVIQLERGKGHFVSILALNMGTTKIHIKTDFNYLSYFGIFSYRVFINWSYPHVRNIFLKK